MPVLDGLLLRVQSTIGARCRVGAAVEEGARVARVVQHLQRARVNQLRPDQFAAADAATQSSGKEKPTIVEVLDRRAGRPRLFEGREKRSQRLLDLTIRIEDDAVLGIVNEADGQRCLEFAAAGLVQNAAAQPGAKNVKLRFRKCSLEPVRRNHTHSPHSWHPGRVTLRKGNRVVGSSLRHRDGLLLEGGCPVARFAYRPTADGPPHRPPRPTYRRTHSPR